MKTSLLLCCLLLATVTDQRSVLGCGARLCEGSDNVGSLTIVADLFATQHNAGFLTPTCQGSTNYKISGLIEPDPCAAVTIIDDLSIAQKAAGLAVMLSCR